MRRNFPLLLVRIIVGIVFLTEGILKFMLPEELGSGRFAHIGLPVPHVLAPVVGIVEIISGAAVILDIYTGEAAVLLLAVIITALITTKIPILLGHPLGRFDVPVKPASPPVEQFTISFNKTGGDSASLVLDWNTLRGSVDVKEKGAGR